MGMFGPDVCCTCCCTQVVACTLALVLLMRNACRLPLKMTVLLQEMVGQGFLMQLVN
jgi:hypothetical protein